MNPAAALTDAPDADPQGGAGAFYADCLREVAAADVPCLVAGAYALFAHTGLRRRTKDLDLVCRAGDATRLLAHFAARGWRTAAEEPAWVCKVLRDGHTLDIIYASRDGVRPVDDSWFGHGFRATLFGAEVELIAPTEMIWQKAYIQLRHRFDGPDIAHLILRAHDRIDWRRLLLRMDRDWELLLGHLLAFRWTYPGERDLVPGWLMAELLRRQQRQLTEAPPAARLSRGDTLSCFDYVQDYQEWGYAADG